jgi:hypothetical protein
LLYLRGLSTGDFVPALEELLGEAARGFSATTIVRLKQGWKAKYQQWRRRDLGETDYVYIWADGVHFNIRLEEDRLTCLVLIGGRRNGTKELIALEEGYRESAEAWLTLLPDMKRCGMPAPALAVGDGALGFWRPRPPATTGVSDLPNVWAQPQDSDRTPPTPAPIPARVWRDGAAAVRPTARLPVGCGAAGGGSSPD